jgi:hypothetical protein
MIVEAEAVLTNIARVAQGQPSPKASFYSSRPRLLLLPCKRLLALEDRLALFHERIPAFDVIFARIATGDDLFA